MALNLLRLEARPPTPKPTGCASRPGPCHSPVALASPLCNCSRIWIARSPDSLACSVFPKRRLILEQPTEYQRQAKLNVPVRPATPLTSRSYRRDCLAVGVRFSFSVAKSSVDQADLGGMHWPITSSLLGPRWRRSDEPLVVIQPFATAGAVRRLPPVAAPIGRPAR